MPAEEWIIRNAAGYQWGDETYPTKEAAEAELKSFFKGWKDVRLDRFTFEDRAALRPALQPEGEGR